MAKSEVIRKIREHLRIVNSCALMLANAQAADVRIDYLKRLTEQLKKVAPLLDKLEEN